MKRNTPKERRMQIMRYRIDGSTHKKYEPKYEPYHYG